MNLSRLVLVMSLGLSSTGCLSNPDPLPVDVAPPHFKTLVGDPGGGIGPNGLLPSSFHAHKYQLLDATNYPFLEEAYLSEQLIKIGLQELPEGKDTLEYAVGCAFPDGVTIYDQTDNNKDYHGQGLLSSTPSWGTSATGLSPQAKEDLFACMALHLNPSGHTVSIYLQGVAVPDDLADKSEHTFQEGLWTAVVGGPAPLTIHVWPLEDLESACPDRLEGAIQTRFCAPGIADCGLVIHHDKDADCTISAEGFYTCNGRPAIKTKLKPEEVSYLYGGCGS